MNPRACRRIHIAVSQNIGHGLAAENSGVIGINVMKLSFFVNKCRERLHHFSGDGVFFVVSQKRNSNRAGVVPGRMTRHHSITSGTSFKDASVWSHNKVITNISPATRDGMVIINGANGGFRIIQICGCCGVMDDDFFDFGRVFFGPQKLVPVFVDGHGVHNAHIGVGIHIFVGQFGFPLGTEFDVFVSA